MLTIAIQAQETKPRYSVFGGPPDERACNRIEYFDNQKKIVQQFAIDYGTPVWKKEYEDASKFDAMTNGKIWRFGSNFWTRLESQIPLKIGGKSIPAGVHYLGLKRSQDGTQWSLVIIDPAKARAAGVYDAFMINKAPVEYETSMTVEKPTEIKDKLTVMLTAQKENTKNITLRISWGQLQLSTLIEAVLEG
jgi:hypothetical protein